MKRKEIALTSAMSLCLGILLCGRELGQLLPGAVASAVFEFCLYKSYERIASRLRRPHPIKLALALAVTVLLAYAFTVRWYKASPIKAFAALTHTDHNAVRRILGTLLGIGAYCPVLVIVDAVFELVKRKNDIYRILLASALELFALEVSAIPVASLLTWSRLLPILINLLMVFTLNMLLFGLIRRRRAAMLPSLLLLFIWSIADYYVIEFHGSPLFFSTLKNAATAMDVAGSYTYSVSLPVILSAAGILAGALAVFVPGEAERRAHAASEEENASAQRRGAGKGRGPLYPLLLAAAVLLSDVLGYAYLYRGYHFWKSWDANLLDCGYLVTSIVDLKRTLFPLTEPESYASFDPKDYPASEAVDAGGTQAYPDVILILNETFFDLEDYMGVSAQPEALADYYAIPGAVYGKAVCPYVGGGTNNSEYELLSSRSVFLLNSQSPFFFLNNERLSRTVVEYLRSLGYTSVGMHCGNPKNYNRNNAYPTLGFGEVHLGAEEFTLQYYGERRFLDGDNYRDMIGWYSDLPEGPRFMFLLTYQNHGGYARNPEELDTVHITADLGESTAPVNEYLTSTSMSASAFRELTEYFAHLDRQVIVCMVGDHAPSFIPSMPEAPDIPIKDITVARRSVPYVIWSNFGAAYDGYTEYASMVDLVPMTLKAAGVPLSGFYSEILSLHEEVPIRTSEGLWVDRDFRLGVYEQGSPRYELISRYYNLEYNSLLLNEDYCAELFEP